VRVVRFSPTALSDLDEIWMYLAEVASPELARTVNRRLKDQLKRLARWPYLGAAVFGKPSFRKYPLAPYLVLYRPIASGIEVSRVVHGKRDLKRILREL
jgi:toxin ParE1/3/4